VSTIPRLFVCESADRIPRIRDHEGFRCFQIKSSAGETFAALSAVDHSNALPLAKCFVDTGTATVRCSGS